MNCTKAIITKYLPATNHRGRRISAIMFQKRITVPYDHALDVLDNHRAAAIALLYAAACGPGKEGDASLESRLHTRTMPNGNSYAHFLEYE